MTVYYNNLSGALKTATVLAYITGILSLLGFMVGFIEGVVGY